MKPSLQPYTWSTAVGLADALGVSRNSIAAWVKQGAPAAKPYDELGWRIWLAARGNEDVRTPERPLLEQLAKAGVPLYRRMLEQLDAGPAPAADPALPPVTASGAGQQGIGAVLGGFAGDDAERYKALDKYLDVQGKLLDLEKRKRSLIPADEIAPLIDALAAAALTPLLALPRLADEISDQPDVRARARRLIDDAITNARRTLGSEARSLVRRLLPERAPT